MAGRFGRSPQTPALRVLQQLLHLRSFAPIAAQRRLDAWQTAAHAPAGTDAAPTVRLLREALRNDLDAPTALRTIDEWSSAVLAGDDSPLGVGLATAEATE